MVALPMHSKHMIVKDIYNHPAVVPVCGEQPADVGFIDRVGVCITVYSTMQ